MIPTTDAMAMTIIKGTSTKVGMLLVFSAAVDATVFIKTPFLLGCLMVCPDTYQYRQHQIIIQSSKANDTLD